MVADGDSIYVPDATAINRLITSLLADGDTFYAPKVRLQRGGRSVATISLSHASVGIKITDENVMLSQTAAGIGMKLSSQNVTQRRTEMETVIQ
jgi:hypothetical protein